VVVVCCGVVVVGDGVVVVVDPIGLVELVVDRAVVSGDDVVVGGDDVVVGGVTVMVVVGDVDESAAEKARYEAFLGVVDVDQTAEATVRMTRALKETQESHRLVPTIEYYSWPP
jgi:hypothetical protein